MALHFPDLQAATAAAFDDPQPGDLFTEFFAHWVVVIDRAGGAVTWLTVNAPATLPADGERHHATLADFRKRYAYGSIPGYWVKLEKRGLDVSGWNALFDETGEGEW